MATVIDYQLKSLEKGVVELIKSDPLKMLALLVCDYQRYCANESCDFPEMWSYIDQVLVNTGLLTLTEVEEG